MKKQLLTLGLAMAALGAHAADVGVSVSISQPGVHGRIDIGRFPQPQVVVAQPVVVHQPAVVVAPAQPVYLWVPPGHRKKWRKHCHKYDACGVPVYFVQDEWYERHVMVAHHHHKDKGHKHKHKHKHERDDD